MSMPGKFPERREDRPQGDHADIEHRFKYHPPQGDQAKTYGRIRSFARDYALFLVGQCPNSRERALAITAVENSVFWANASIARHETEEEADGGVGGSSGGVGGREGRADG